MSQNPSSNAESSSAAETVNIPFSTVFSPKYYAGAGDETYDCAIQSTQLDTFENLSPQEQHAAQYRRLRMLEVFHDLWTSAIEARLKWPVPTDPTRDPNDSNQETDIRLFAQELGLLIDQFKEHNPETKIGTLTMAEIEVYADPDAPLIPAKGSKSAVKKTRDAWAATHRAVIDRQKALAGETRRRRRTRAHEITEQTSSADSGSTAE